VRKRRSEMAIEKQFHLRCDECGDEEPGCGQSFRDARYWAERSGWKAVGAKGLICPGCLWDRENPDEEEE
jgi:hypothetical protein